MSKKAVMISIDEFIHAEAKKRFWNMSELCENAIRDKLKGKIDAKEEEKECRYCKGKEDLVFLCPDEIWICPKCLKNEIKRVPVAIAVRK